MFSYERIGITSVGRNYLKAPDLVVVDRITKSVVKEAVLEYELGDTEVSIIENSKGISSKNSEIIPINNTNGVGISTISFDSGNKNVIVTLGSSFSNASNFPFDVGDKVLVENISVGIGSTAKGFNSKKLSIMNSSRLPLLILISGALGQQSHTISMVFLVLAKQQDYLIL